MNCSTGKWDSICCDYFDIKESFLPKIVPNSFRFGTLAEGSFRGIPITGMIADQQASLLSHCHGKLNQLKCTYGTGCFIMANIDKNPTISSNSEIFKTVAYQFENDELHYALECYIPACGCIFQWMVEELSFAGNFDELDFISQNECQNSQLRYIPPTQKNNGSIEGITVGTKKSEIIRSIYEGIFKNIAVHIDLVNKQLDSPADVFYADGGLCQSDFCMQLQANLTNLSIKRFELIEATALGAAICALKGIKQSSNISEIFPEALSKYNTFLSNFMSH